jgi:hypothetical protein
LTRDWRKRALLAVALLAAAVGPVSETQALATLPYPRGLAAVVPLAWLSQPPGQIAAFVVIVLLLGAFVRGRRMELAGLGVFFVILMLHAVVRSMHLEEADHNQASQMPCASLLAWIVGSMLAPRFGRDRDELGSTLAAGVVAAGYTSAALSKLLHAGAGWIDGRTLALLIYERSLDTIAPLAWVRQTLAHHPDLCAVGMALALLIECAGVLFVLRRTRRAYAAAVVAFHATSALLLGYSHVEWALAVIVWAWAGPVAEREAPASAATEPLAQCSA